MFVAPATWGGAASPADGRLAIRAETGADGRFEFDAPDMTTTAFDGLPTRRPCIVIAACRGYAPDWIEVWGRCLRYGWIQMPVKGTGLELRLAKDDVPIQGRVLDPEGRPISGARVDISSVGVPKGRDLDAFLDRHIKANPFVELDREFDRTLAQPDLLPGVTSKTLTDANGRFTLSGFGRERLCRLEVTPPGAARIDLGEFMTRAVPDVSIMLGGLAPEQAKQFVQVIHGADFTIKIKPVKIDHGRTVHGVVLDRDTRKPIAGMRVGPGHDRLGLLTGNYSTATNVQGRFTISGILAGQSVLANSPPGLPYPPAFAKALGDAEMQIECKRGIPYHLRLVNGRDDRSTPRFHTTRSCLTRTVSISGESGIWSAVRPIEAVGTTKDLFCLGRGLWW